MKIQFSGKPTFFLVKIQQEHSPLNSLTCANRSALLGGRKWYADGLRFRIGDGDFRYFAYRTFLKPQRKRRTRAKDAMALNRARHDFGQPLNNG